MNKNFKIFLIILLNGWNNFSEPLENNSEIKLEIKNEPLINESITFAKYILYSNKIKNNFLYFNDPRYPILVTFIFCNVIFVSSFISSLGLLFQKHLNFGMTNNIHLEKSLIITMIMGVIILIIGIILMFIKFTSYIFNGNKIPFKNTLVTNIFIIILSIYVLFFYLFIFKGNNIHYFFLLINVLLPIIIFIFILIITIYVLYQNKSMIKNKFINPIMDSLYTKLLDISSIFLSLFIGIFIYCIFAIIRFKNKTKILYEPQWSGFISGSLYLIIILIVILIRKMNIKDNLIILLSFFISYPILEWVFIFKNKYIKWLEKDNN
jgi:hypothetical protein